MEGWRVTVYSAEWQITILETMLIMLYSPVCFIGYPVADLKDAYRLLYKYL